MNSIFAELGMSVFEAMSRLGREDDVAFRRKVVEEHGVAAIPASAFYAENLIRPVVRFCFAKRDATLDRALDRLSAVAMPAHAS
jgi:aspartate/methionine/tyrosine aminotransferase